MASNVELRKVREAVVAAIVEKIQVVEGDSAEQRKQIAQVVARWGPLIDKIGGIDPVETVEVLQVCVFVKLFPGLCEHHLPIQCPLSTIVRDPLACRCSGKFLLLSIRVTW